MPADPRLVVVVPAHDEAAAIEGVLEALRRWRPEARVCVVNDGSTDDTAARVRRWIARRRNDGGEVPRQPGDVVLLDLPVNLGIGGAVQAGLRWFLAGDGTHVVQVDGDGQHPPAEVDRLLARADEADVVVGSRFLGDGAWRSTPGRRLGIRLLAAWLRLLGGPRVTDPTSGLRLFNRRAAAALLPGYPDDFPEPVTLMLAARAGLRVVEVPVRMAPRQGGRSSLEGVVAGYYMAKVMLALLLLRLGGRIGG